MEPCPQAENRTRIEQEEEVRGTGKITSHYNNVFLPAPAMVQLVLFKILTEYHCTLLDDLIFQKSVLICLRFSCQESVLLLSGEKEHHVLILNVTDVHWTLKHDDCR